MNERIRELAVQATQEFSPAFESNKWQEKFAELIVKECVDIVKWTPSMFPNDAIIKNIKEHFGVEE
jgi:hypothetical protein